MRINPAILRAYDIRGKYPDELTLESAARIGNAFAKYLKTNKKIPAPRVLVARDIRASSELLRHNLAEGLITGGADVTDMGIATTPEFYFFVEESKSIDAGIMITASHNPPEYNGFKFSLKGSGEFGKDQGLGELFLLAGGKEYKSKTLGKIHMAKSEAQRYIARLLRIVPDISEVKAVVDAGGGSTSFSLPALLSRYPILYKPLYLNPDPLFISHSPNPLDPDVDRLMQKELKGGNYQVGVAFDADGDRVAFFDERGERIRTDVIFALLAKERLEAKPRTAFVYEVTRGRFLEPFIAAHGGSLHISKVGGVYVREAMRKTHAELGGEISGHYYHKELWRIDSALLTMLKMFCLVARARRPLSEMKHSLTQAHIKQCDIATSRSASQFKAVKAEFEGRITSSLDGYSVEFPQWWFNIRKSNTEPLIRLTVEADSDHEVDQHIKEIRRLIS